MKDTVALLKVIFDFLSSLSDEQLRNLIEKKIKLRIDNQKQLEPEKKTVPDVGEICAKLNIFTTKEQARDLFNNIVADKPTLKEIAKHYSIPVLSNDTNAQLVDKIIENVVGAKMKFDTLLNTKIN